MSFQQTYHLTETVWREHQAHRRQCGDPLCDHGAHHYARAHADRRVLVGGIPVDEGGVPMPPDPDPDLNEELLREAVQQSDRYRDLVMPLSTGEEIRRLAEHDRGGNSLAPPS